MLQAIAKLLLRLGGWTIVGGLPRPAKAVLVAAPHTSNWDGVWALIYKVAVQLDVRWFAKESLFWFPLGTLLRGLGGIPLDRSQAGSAVEQAVGMFRDLHTFYFGLAPEGTRSRTEYWKSGFYRIARDANVPIVLGFLDYGSKRLGLGPTLYPSGNPDADLAIIRDFYEGIEGRWPLQASPVQFAERGNGQPERRRTIRSFVRRAGRITPSQQRALRELWPRFGVEFAEAPLDFEALFGRAAPVVLEIGFGNGETLVEQAAARPECNFLGVEVHEPGVGHCLLKAEEAGIDNLRIVCHDAIEVLKYQVPAASLSRVNLYFPDPWPKKRHHKRRIVQPAFLDLVAERLQAGGALHVATDWVDYAAHIDKLLDARPDFECVERREHGGDRPLDRPRTKFERRGLRHGHRIHDWRFFRVHY